jgi:two-component system chemotaxis response regulator CheY
MDNSRYSILAVDDSPSMRKMITYTLCEAGYQCDCAENGQDALEKAAEKKFDLVIMDINMPVMNGIDAIGELRKTDDYKSAPIIVLSTESRDEIKQKGRKAGATGWIVKPFDPDKLIAAMKRVLV